MKETTEQVQDQRRRNEGRDASDAELSATRFGRTSFTAFDWTTRNKCLPHHHWAATWFSNLEPPAVQAG